MGQGSQYGHNNPSAGSGGNQGQNFPTDSSLPPGGPLSDQLQASMATAAGMMQNLLHNLKNASNNQPGMMGQGSGQSSQPGILGPVPGQGNQSHSSDRGGGFPDLHSNIPGFGQSVPPVDKGPGGNSIPGINLRSTRNLVNKTVIT